MTDKRKSNSPTQPPAWVIELLQQIRFLRQDFQRHETEIREIRYLSAENQQLLRDVLSNTQRARPNLNVASPQPNVGPASSAGSSSRAATQSAASSRPINRSSSAKYENSPKIILPLVMKLHRCHVSAVREPAATSIHKGEPVGSINNLEKLQSTAYPLLVSTNHNAVFRQSRCCNEKSRTDRQYRSSNRSTRPGIRIAYSIGTKHGRSAINTINIPGTTSGRLERIIRHFLFGQ